MVIAIATSIAVVAFLYATVGHAGASGYIAVLTLAGLPPAVIRPTALLLNVAVASLATWQFQRAGHLRVRTFWPVLVAGVPAAFLGGSLDLPVVWFQRLVGLVLLASALYLLLRPAESSHRETPRAGILAFSGAGLGLLAGLTGTGGGVFLTPLLLLRGWCTTRQAAAVSALFILLNSLAGLAGLAFSRPAALGAALPYPAAPLLPVVLLAGGLGARLGSRHLPVPAIRRLLALVLTVAAIKLLGSSA
ncbi:MAG TPA: sulfite exporter TauE/SafE family protein [Cyanobium sp.]|nr:sulfite exporter TauE/SafE family protein [Cyanobium sp.]